MPVFRVEKNTNYTVMSNHHLRNMELSLKAKGLLSQMLSLPENWDYTLSGLAKINRDRIDSVRAAVNELESAGYVKRTRERDEKGRLQNADYIIYENPQGLADGETPASDSPMLENPTLEKPILENPTQVKPILEKPTQEKPTLENPRQLNKEVIKKEEQNTNLTKNGKTKESRGYGLYQNVLLSEDDVRLLQKEYPSVWMDWVEKLSEYMASTGKSYGNHLATIRSWAKKEAERNMPKRYVYDRFPRTEEDSL